MIVIAVLIGSACYGLIVHALWAMTRNVFTLQPLPLNKLREIVEMLYWTVRYEDDETGMWQIVEDRDGNRYRILLRDNKGEMKW